MIKLRVITATRGNSLHLTAAVNSVRRLVPDVRVHHILVCPKLSHLKLELEFPLCDVVDEEGPGLYAALNTGLKVPGDDEFFTWLNDDDVIVEEGFLVALRQLAGEPALAAIYGRVGLIDVLTETVGDLPVARRAEDLPALLSSGIMPLAQPGTIFRWSAVQQIGPFDASYRLAGDLDFFVRAIRAGLRFGFIDERLAWFRLSPGQLSKDETTAALEHARAIEAMPRLPAGAARRRFRWDNRWVYWQRIRDHGFKRMSTIYRHG